MALLHHIVGGFLIAFLFYAVYTKTNASCSLLCSATGRAYLQPVRLPQWDVILGLDVLYKDLQLVRRRQYLTDIWERHKQLGRTWSYVTSGTRTINSIEPAIYKAVLVTLGSKFELGRNRMNVLEPGIGHGLLTLDGQIWRHARDLTEPAFRRISFLRRVPFEKYVQLMVQHMLSSVEKGQPIDLQLLFSRFTLDTSTDLVFGKPLGCLDWPEPSDHAKDVEFSMGQILTRVQQLMMNTFCAWLPTRGHANALQYITRYIEREVDLAFTRREAGEIAENSCIVDFFVQQAEQRHPTHAARKSSIVDQLFHVILAGRDTTASLLSNLFFELARNPDIYELLRQEVSDLHGQPPQLQDLNKHRYPYLRMCINETLRLYPSAPLNNRRATEDVMLPCGGGPDGTAPLLLEKGDEITFHLFSMHRLQQYFGPNTEKFLPHRWASIKAEDAWAFRPFSGGRRLCIGQQFAYEEASYATIRLLQYFSRISNADNRPWIEDLGVLLANASGCHVLCEPSSLALKLSSNHDGEND